MQVVGKRRVGGTFTHCRGAQATHVRRRLVTCQGDVAARKGIRIGDLCRVVTTGSWDVDAAIYQARGFMRYEMIATLWLVEMGVSECN